ncbi:glycosyltransferase family 9 protein [Massilia sp. YIM B02763]|uniref:glycosyltransferase family 9 protein n=1 Tax=Massilia sp. YIM B02763 TaxID=3050130 RepID=UPI0025B68510|nr:glycosyltransferase family 9 protein [Massilia sp. YIM B02763]MDN4053530.1 glycosyltransferase family 9 protein [Massilia sp. YIM B02763]
MSRRPLLQRLDPPSVVVFRALHLGDMLCTVPALRSLRAALPRAHIALVGLPWAQQFADRFAAYVDEFIPFPGHPLLPEQPARQDTLARFYNRLCARRFALAIQLHGNGDISNDIVTAFGAQAMAGFCRGPAVNRDSLVLFPYPEIGAEPERLQSLMTQLGATPAGTHLEFPLSRQDEEELQASGIGQGLEPGDYLCIHPGARTRDKCWPPSRFAEVGDRLAAEFGLQVVLTGSAAERDLTAEVAAHMHHTPIDAAAPISIGAMAVLLRDARLLLCNDTGVSHIASGLKLKSVVVFSKADIARWAPLDRMAHRCIWDPGAERAKVVLQHARALLSDTAPSRQRSVGMWPYW